MEIDWEIVSKGKEREYENLKCQMIIYKKDRQSTQATQQGDKWA